MASVNDTIVISENVSISRLNSGVQIFMNGENISNSIIPSSVVRENVITRQVDRAKFTLRNYGNNNTHVPVVGHAIEIYNDGTRIFGGVVIKFIQRAENYKIILFDIECEDYTRLLDRRLVVNSYKNKTIQQIIEDINDNFLTDFTINNVKGTSKVVSYMAFNYIPASQCLQKLADLINYDWYVDYDRDIHFFAKGYTTAPFSLSDEDGSYIFNSLKIRRDNSQLKNKIFVRGGEFLADTLTTEFISDGIQNVYTLPYRYDEMQTSVTGIVWEQGVDNIDVPSTRDYIWNNEEKFIRFRGDRIPNDTSSIKVSGQPYLPVRVVVQDDISIAQMVSVEGGIGEYEFLIIDNSINSREGARERATAELESYKNTLSEGSFRTYKDGLEAGQTITINSSAHGISEDFMINKVTARMWTHEGLQYDISLVTTKTMGIIEFLQKLLTKSSEEIIINENEVLDLVYSKSESLGIADSIETSISHNPVSESLTNYEGLGEHDVDFPIEFVVGQYIPEDPDLVARLKLDEGLGSIANDSSKNGIDGTLIGGGITWDTGIDNSAVRFNTLTTDQIELENALLTSLMTQLGTYTISCWVYQFSTGVNMNVWNWNGGGNNRHNLNLNGTTVGFQRYNGSDYFAKRKTGTSNLNKWTHYICENNAGTVKLYIDNVEAVEGGNEYAIAPSGDKLILGYPNSTLNGSQAVDGKIDDFRVCSRVLNETERTELFNNPIFTNFSYLDTKRVFLIGGSQLS